MAETSSSTAADAAAAEVEAALPADEEAEVAGAPDKAFLLTKHMSHVYCQLQSPRSSLLMSGCSCEATFYL